MTSIAAPQLNARLHEQWLTFSRDHKTVPDIQIFVDFLKEKMATTAPSTAPQSKTHHHEVKRTKTTVCAAAASDTCMACGGEHHPLYFCSTFKTLPHDKKISLVHTHRLCHNCLIPGHSSKVCRNVHRCKKCNKAHHTTLHVDGRPSNPTSQPNDGKNSAATASTPAEPQKGAVVTISAPVHPISTTPEPDDATLPPTLQMTSQVYVESHDGRRLMARALIDSGASISQRLVQQLHLKQHYQPISISGVQDTAVGVSQHSTSFVVASVTSQNRIQVSASIVPKVSSNLPLQIVNEAKSWDFIKDLTLADPRFAIPGKIDHWVMAGS